jgi:hypothetical protein
VDHRFDLNEYMVGNNQPTLLKFDAFFRGVFSHGVYHPIYGYKHGIWDGETINQWIWERPM